jgi:hypothetical protein
MLKLFVRGVSFAVIISSFPAASAQDGVAPPPASAVYLNHPSNVIVIGTATQILSPSNQLGVSIAVLRVLKGNSTLAGTSFNLTISEGPVRCSISQTASPVTAVWCLDQTPEGQFVFASSPKVHVCNLLRSDFEVPDASPSGDWYYPQNASPEDKLGYELAASLEAHSGKGPLVLLKNPEALEGLTAKTKSDIYTKLAQSQISNIRTIGKLGLIRMGDPATLSEIAAPVTPLTSASLQTNATQGGKPTKLLYGDQGTIQTYSSYIAISIRQIVESKDATVSAIGLLLAPGVTKSEIRRAAARALRNIHTAKAVSYLAPLLYDDDAELRVEAIGGLACFANGVPVLDPAKPDGGFDLNKPGPYKTDETMSHFAMGSSTISSRETFFLTYWRSWWNNYGASI